MHNAVAKPILGNELTQFMQIIYKADCSQLSCAHVTQNCEVCIYVSQMLLYHKRHDLIEILFVLKLKRMVCIIYHVIKIIRARDTMLAG